MTAKHGDRASNGETRGLELGPVVVEALRQVE
jgi:hypothetical protein